MSEDMFLKKAFELRSAVDTFVSSYPNDTGTVVASISTMRVIIKELEDVWAAYLEAGSSGEARKMHVKCKTKLEMLKNHVGDSVRACGSDSRLRKKFGDGQEYLMKKVAELQAELPKSPREVKVVQLSFDDLVAPPPAPVRESRPVEDMFARKMSEMRTCVTGFVESYSEEDRRRSVVAYISDIAMYVKGLENLWRRYNSAVHSVESIHSLYKCMRTELNSIHSYFEMSVMISKANGVDGKYARNHEYVKRKIQQHNFSLKMELSFMR